MDLILLAKASKGSRSHALLYILKPSETAGFHLWVSDACALASETSAPSSEGPRMKEGLPGPPDTSSSTTCSVGVGRPCLS